MNFTACNSACESGASCPKKGCYPCDIDCNQGRLCPYRAPASDKSLLYACLIVAGVVVVSALVVAVLR